MRLGFNIQARRLSRGQSVEFLAAKAGLPTVLWQSRPPGRFEPPSH